MEREVLLLQIMEGDQRLPLADSRRRERRDAKLAFLEELLADRTNARKRVCPCNICLGQTRCVLFTSVVNDHLRQYGRHPFHRGSTEVHYSHIYLNFVYIPALLETYMHEWFCGLKLFGS